MSHNDTIRETKLIGGTTGKEVLKKGFSIDDENLWPLELITSFDNFRLKLEANCS